VIQNYRVVEYEGLRGPWKVQIVAYYYTLSNENEQEILAYHWHPAQQSEITFPHLHIGPGVHLDPESLGEAHLPTGRIAVEDVIRLAIRDFGV
jgi:hypothetical protein